MLRDEVADHYRAKGYMVRERVKVRGESGTVHAIDMVAQGPLGNLMVAFGDESGFEVAELGSVRRAARDIGATAVVALKHVPDSLRAKAAQTGVVVLDEAALHAPPPEEPTPSEPEQTPWPDARRQTETAGKSTDPGFWRYPREAAVKPEPRFGWLPQDTSNGTVATGGTVLAEKPVAAPSVPRPLEPRSGPPSAAPAANRAPRVSRLEPVPRWIWLASAAVFGAAAGGTFYAFLRILG